MCVLHTTYTTIDDVYVLLPDGYATIMFGAVKAGALHNEVHATGPAVARDGYRLRLKTILYYQNIIA